MSLPFCPTDCSSNLPTLSFNRCAPEINNGQISKIYFTTVGNPLANWTSAAEWDSRIENDAAGASKIRMIAVIASKPVPEKTETNISLGRTIKGVKTFTVPFKIDETNETNHNAVRELECNTGNFLFWYETRDGLLYGSSQGIEGQIEIDDEIPEAYEEIITFPGTLKWKSKFTPERITSPITDDTGDQFTT